MIETGALVQWVSGEVLSAAWGEAKARVLGGRLEVARSLLLDELERGNATLADVDQDQAAAMVFEYASAAERGVARRNLRALAQLLAGELLTPPIYADNFLRWSRVLADLSREELIVLAKFFNAWKLPQDDPSLRGIRTFQYVLKELQEAKVCVDENDFESVLQALTRTGFVISQSGFGRIIYAPTLKLDQIMKLIRIEDVMNEPDR